MFTSLCRTLSLWLFAAVPVLAFASDEIELHLLNNSDLRAEVIVHCEGIPCITLAVVTHDPIYASFITSAAKSVILEPGQGKTIRFKAESNKSDWDIHFYTLVEGEEIIAMRTLNFQSKRFNSFAIEFVERTFDEREPYKRPELFWGDSCDSYGKSPYLKSFPLNPHTPTPVLSIRYWG